MIYQDSKIERAPKSAFAIIPGKNYQTYQKASTSFSEGQKNLFLQIKAKKTSLKYIAMDYSSRVVWRGGSGSGGLKAVKESNPGSFFQKTQYRIWRIQKILATKHYLPRYFYLKDWLVMRDGLAFAKRNRCSGKDLLISRKKCGSIFLEFIHRNVCGTSPPSEMKDNISSHSLNFNHTRGVLSWHWSQLYQAMDTSRYQGVRSKDLGNFWKENYRWCNEIYEA